MHGSVVRRVALSRDAFSGMNGAGVSASTASSSPARGPVSSADIGGEICENVDALLPAAANLQRVLREYPSGQMPFSLLISHVCAAPAPGAHGSLQDTKLRASRRCRPPPAAYLLRCAWREFFILCRSACMHSQEGNGGGGGGFLCSQVKVPSKKFPSYNN